MNLIIVTMDSLNRHFLKSYGGTEARTPHLDAFAKRAVRFANHYSGSLPCMPARREMWTGTSEMWWRGWGPIETWDRPIAYLAGLSGVKTQLITDHYHFFEWGAHSYQNDFEGYTFIRGHEHDNWVTKGPHRASDDTRQLLALGGQGILIHARNVQDFRDEMDFFSPRTFNAACTWLDENHADDRPFYLHIDEFDPHEPFYAPEPYRSMYTDDPGPRAYWPRYGRVGPGVDERDIAWLRAQYAGVVTMVDRWFGVLLGRLDRYNLWENTAVIVTTDHGHYLGDHGWLGKPRAPLHDVLVKIPLFVYLPGTAARSVHAYTQTVDIYATALEILGCPVPDTENNHSRSLVPLVTGERDRHRAYVVYGYFGDRVGITANGWTLCRGHDPERAPAYQYTNDLQVFDRSYVARIRPNRRFGPPDMAPANIPGVEVPVWRAHDERYDQIGRHEDILFHTAEDPNQTENLASTRSDMLSELESMLRQHVAEIGAPPEVIARLHLDS